MAASPARRVLVTRAYIVKNKQSQHNPLGMAASLVRRVLVTQLPVQPVFFSRHTTKS